MLRDDNRLKRLTEFLDGFACAFAHGGQSGNAHRFVRGLLSDVTRKNTEEMLRRLSDPGQYQRCSASSRSRPGRLMRWVQVAIAAAAVSLSRPRWLARDPASRARKNRLLAVDLDEPVVPMR